MSEQSGIRLEDLSQSQREIAELIGQDNFRKLMNAYGGGYIYIPKTDRLDRQDRNERIRSDFNGYNSRELSKKYDLTEVSIRSIVADRIKETRARPIDGQLSFL